MTASPASAVYLTATAGWQFGSDLNGTSGGSRLIVVAPASSLDNTAGASCGRFGRGPTAWSRMTLGDGYE